MDADQSRDMDSDDDVVPAQMLTGSSSGGPGEPSSLKTSEVRRYIQCISFKFGHLNVTKVDVTEAQ
jgi:hypothetical protein